MKKIHVSGARVIYRRYRKVRGGKILDARDYGYEAWPIFIKTSH
jgi:hypothetical protein